MRRASVLVLFALVGCVSDDNANPPPGQDAGVVPLPDGSIPIVDGGHDATITDATVPDTSTTDTSVPDVAPDTTPPGVTVTVLDAVANLPETGITLVFSDKTGAFLSSATTDATGTVAAQLPADAIVTAVFGTTTEPRFVTVVGVQPGDSLTAIDTSVPGAPPSITIEAPPPGTPDGGAHYQFQAGNCYGGDPPTTIQLRPGCIAKGETSVVSTALDTSFAIIPGYAVQKGVGLDGGVADSGYPAVALTSPFQATGPTFTMLANGVPTNVNNGYLFLSELSGGVPFSSGQYFTSSQADAGSLSMDFLLHVGLADKLQSEVQVADYPGNGSVVSAIATRGAVPADGGAATVDLAQLLPELTDAQIDGTDLTRPIVSWGTDAGSLAGVDGAFVTITWSGPQSGAWTFVVPPTATRVQAPALPASLLGYLPDAEAGASYNTPPTVAVVEGSFITGYDQLRATFASLPDTGYPNNSRQVVPPLPVDGTLRVTEYTVNGD